MPELSYAYNTRRNPGGLAVTVALHAGLVALLLIGFGVVPVLDDTPPPIVAREIPDVPPPPPVVGVPKTIFDSIPVNVPIPTFDEVETPKADTSVDTAPAGGGGSVTPALSGDQVEFVKPPAGITRSAAIDPRYRADFEAPYPPASQRLGEEGVVVVRVVVGIDGRVVSAVVAKSSGFARLDEAAVKRALAKWRFIPALRDGQPVEAERELPVRFRLMQG